MPELHGGTDGLKYGPTPEAGADPVPAFLHSDHRADLSECAALLRRIGHGLCRTAPEKLRNQ